MPEEAGTPRSLGPHLIVSTAALALDGTGAAEACRHHPHALAGVGQESDGVAHLLHDGHEVRRRDRLEAWAPPATGPPALGGATPISHSPRRAGDLFHAPRRLTEDRDGSTAPLPTAKTYPPMVGDGPSTHPRHDHEQSSGPGTGLGRGQGQYQS